MRIRNRLLLTTGLLLISALTICVSMRLWYFKIDGIRYCKSAAGTPAYTEYSYTFSGKDSARENIAFQVSRPLIAIENQYAKQRYSPTPDAERILDAALKKHPGKFDIAIVESEYADGKRAYVHVTLSNDEPERFMDVKVYRTDW